MNMYLEEQNKTPVYAERHEDNYNAIVASGRQQPHN